MQRSVRSSHQTVARSEIREGKFTEAWRLNRLPLFWCVGCQVVLFIQRFIFRLFWLCDSYSFKLGLFSLELTLSGDWNVSLNNIYLSISKAITCGVLINAINSMLRWKGSLSCWIAGSCHFYCRLISTLTSLEQSITSFGDDAPLH